MDNHLHMCEFAEELPLFSFPLHFYVKVMIHSRKEFEGCVGVNGRIPPPRRERERISHHSSALDNGCMMSGVKASWWTGVGSPWWGEARSKHPLGSHLAQIDKNCEKPGVARQQWEAPLCPHTSSTGVSLECGPGGNWALSKKAAQARSVSLTWAESGPF